LVNTKRLCRKVSGSPPMAALGPRGFVGRSATREKKNRFFVSKTNMIVRLSEMSRAPVSVRFDLSTAWMESELHGIIMANGRSEGYVEVEAALSGTTVTIYGRVVGSFDVECSRCLGPASVDVDTYVSFVLVKRPAARSLARDVELEPEDMAVSYYDSDQEVDLAPYIREQLALAVPLKPLCRPDCWPEWFGDRITIEAEAQMDDERNGTEAVVDPRWAPLAALKERGQ